MSDHGETITLCVPQELAEFIRKLSGVFSESQEWTINAILRLYREDALSGKHHAALRILSSYWFDKRERMEKEAHLVRQFDELPGSVKFRVAREQIDGVEYCNVRTS